MDISSLHGTSDLGAKKQGKPQQALEDPAVFGRMLNSKAAELVQRGAVQGPTETFASQIASKKVKQISQEDDPDDENREETVEETLDKLKKKMRTLIAIERNFLGL